MKHPGLAPGPMPRPQSLAEPGLRGLEELVASLGGAPGAVRESEVHGALVTLVLRVVFLLMAERRRLRRSSLTALHAELGAIGERDPERLEDYEAWPRLRGLCRAFCASGASLFAPAAAPLLEQDDFALRDRALLGLFERLSVADGERLDYAALDPEALGSAYEGLVGYVVRRASEARSWYLAPTQARRRSGAHYTSPNLTRDLVKRTLAPLLGDPILGLRVCDPAMGSGAFLVEACRQLGDAVSGARCARREVAETCLYGLDRDPLAVHLARLSLWLVVENEDCPLDFVDHTLRCGNALVGLSRSELQTGSVAHRPRVPGARQGELWLARNIEADDDRCRDVADLLVARWFGEGPAPARRQRWTETAARLPRLLVDGPTAAEAAEVEAVRTYHRPFHWQLEFSSVFDDGRGGFDAVIGNPPWVAYAGRAAQPLAPDLRDWYLETSPAFAGYRTLQGLFVDRAASLLRPGGRLGLVLPTSMSDLGGYEPVRRAHDALCVPDPDLPDYGDAAFSGVFQPSMGLVSTRRPAPLSSVGGGPWPLVRPDLDAPRRRLLGVIEARPKLPPHLFGERGYQTRRSDLCQMRESSGPEGRFSTPLRTGTEVEPFRTRPPRLFCDRSALSGRFRPDEEWQRVGLLIRQTARYPLVAWSDGLPFRNSVLAGFGDDQHDQNLLVAWLNSSPIRWFHYHKQRDARQGMPQVKIAHLRDLPAPPKNARVTRELAELGHRLGERNGGVSPTEQRRLDELVSEALGLAPAELRVIREWAAETRG